MVSQFYEKMNDDTQKSAQTHQNPQHDTKTIPKSQQNKSNCGCHSSKQTPFIGTYHQAPEWMRYQQLTIGYRINFYSFKLILKSLFMIHNQTTNVWTHLLGTAILLLTAVVTCTDLLSVFQMSGHAHLPLYEDIHPLGSGQSFIENITQQCINQQYLLNHQSSSFSFSQSDKLAYDICQNHPDRHECYIKKSHQTKLRNWLELNIGVPLDKIQEMKLFVEQKIAPDFVHQMEDKIHNNTNSLLFYLENYLHLYGSNYQEENSNIYNRLSQNANQQNLSRQDKNNDSLARWPLVFYLVCNSICLLCSVTYHLFYPLSQRAHSLCVCTDFAGISVLFGGSAIPCIYYGMYCYFEVGEIYLTGIICASILVFGLSFTNKFQNRKSSTFRVFIYFVFACFMVTPLFHMSINELVFNNYNDSYSFVSSLQWYILGLLFFGIGGFFYASQTPNRFSRTGKYDIFGHSHHYWHIFVVMAIMTIYIGCLQNYFTRKESTCAIVY